MTVSSRWLGRYQCQVEVRQFELRVDEPETAGGEDTGPRPTDLLLSAVASCFTLAIAHVARKHERAVDGLRVEVFGEYDGPRFSKLMIRATADIPADDLAWLAERAKRVCYVTNTLGCDVEYLVM